MIKFSELTVPGIYTISNVSNSNPKFSGMGILEENTLAVRYITKHLVRFDIGLTSFFARRADLDVTLIKVDD